MDAGQPSATTFEEFARAAAELCWTSSAAGVLVIDDGVTTRGFQLDGEHVGPIDLGAVLEAEPRRLAMAARVEWSPEAAGPLSLAWVLVAVEQNRKAWVLVRRLVEDDVWTLIPASAAPQFVVSTVAGLQAALRGEAVTLTEATHADLFVPAALSTPAPPLGEDDLL